MSSVSRPTNPCKNPACGNTLFTAEYSYDGGAESKQVWKCTNCTWTQPRTSRNKKNNRARAHEAWRLLREAWNQTNDVLDEIVKCGHPSGCLLVHSSTFNYHMDKLLMTEKPSNFDIKYHATSAQSDLDRAKEFVKQNLEK